MSVRLIIPNEVAEKIEIQLFSAFCDRPLPPRTAWPEIDFDEQSITEIEAALQDFNVAKGQNWYGLANCGIYDVDALIHVARLLMISHSGHDNWFGAAMIADIDHRRVSQALSEKETFATKLYFLCSVTDWCSTVVFRASQFWLMTQDEFESLDEEIREVLEPFFLNLNAYALNWRS